MWIETSDSELSAIADTLNAAPRQCQRSLLRAINRTVASVRQRYSREIADMAGVKVGAFLKYRTVIIRARAGAGTSDEIKAKWWSGFNEISLGNFQNKQGPIGVTSKGEGKTFKLPHAFMVNKLKGNVFIDPKWHEILPHAIVFSEKQFWPVKDSAGGRQRKAPGSDGAAGAAKRPTPKRPAATGHNQMSSEARRERMAQLRKIRGGAARLAHRWADIGRPETVMKVAESYAAERLTIEFEHELKFEMSRAGR